jgi:hypothetical protein
MEYKIVSRQGDRELEAAVNELIAEGWQPLGGVSVVVLHQTWENERKGYTESDTQWVYSQAMTRSNVLVQRAGPLNLSEHTASGPGSAGTEG